MNDIDLDATLEKAVSTPQGQLRARFVLSDLEKIAPLYAAEQTRAHAEEVLKGWTEGPDALRKGMAMAWLSRARMALSPTVRAAIHGAANGANAVRGAVGAAKGAAGRAAEGVAAPIRNAQRGAENLGAKAGEAIAGSSFQAKKLAAAKEAGGNAARDRMAQRLKPQQRPQGVFEHEAQAAPRMSADGDVGQRGPQLLDAPKHRNFGQEQNGIGQHAKPGVRPGQDPAQRSMAGQQAALDGAHAEGASIAARDHSRKLAEHGRVAARHAFKAGLALGGTAAGIAGAGTATRLSNAQVEERRAAGKHSHDHRGAV